jgi:alpha-D-ribose 1-methylphosphonate 5-triphosphate diphosphatase PhnM
VTQLSERIADALGVGEDIDDGTRIARLVKLVETINEERRDEIERSAHIVQQSLRCIEYLAKTLETQCG